MKKNYFLAKAFAIAAFIGIVNSANAQYFQENFSNGFNGNWAFLDADGLTPNGGNGITVAGSWYIQDENNLVNAYDDTAAVANSWYSPAGQSDDWMWTVNPINLTGATNPRLNWTAYSNSSGFLEDYEVYVDTVNTNFGPSTTLTPVFNIVDGENLTETSRYVDIPAFAGKQVYIAFRDISNDDDLLVIDDIVLAEAPTNPDLVTTATPVEYTKYPISQAANIIGTANVANTGGDATGVDVTVNVWDINGSSIVYTTNSGSTQNINGGSNTNFTFGTYTPTAIGNYAVEFIATANETDANGNNDTTFYIVQVTDSTYARDDADINGISGSLGIGAGASANGKLGQLFELTSADTLTSVDVFLRNSNASLNGQPLVVEVYDVAGGFPNTLLKSSTPITIDTTQNNLWNVEIPNGLIMAPGMYAVVVNEADSNITLGTTTGVFTPGAGVVSWASNPAPISGTWSNSETFSFNVAYVLRPNFGPAPLSVGIEENASANFEVMPNPAVNNIMVKNIENGSTIEIVNNLGQVVYREVSRSTNANISVSEFDNGIYTIKVLGNDNVSTKSFVKQ